MINVLEGCLVIVATETRQPSAESIQEILGWSTSDQHPIIRQHEGQPIDQFRVIVIVLQGIHVEYNIIF